MPTAPKTLKLERRESREWNPPSSAFTPARYSAILRADALAWSKSPESLTCYGDGSIRPDREYVHGKGRYADGYCLNLGCMVGGGWGNRSRETVATWAGGKSWILKDATGYSRRHTLDFLDLPMIDGRLKVIGAPAKPDKGITAWRNRWTVSRGRVKGLVAVAGEGITTASVRAQLAEDLAELAQRVPFTEERIALTRADLANAQQALPAAKARGERTMALLFSLKVEGADGQIRNVSQVAHALDARRRREESADRERGAASRVQRVHARAAAMLASFAAEDARPLAIGVRATRADGTPMHHGAYSAAHAVGVPATAPDWAPHGGCGNGLHYVPAVVPAEEGRHGEILRRGSECVSDALRYASGAYALWIVRAGLVSSAPTPGIDETPEAVMIDGHKAKARTLTPLARVGTVGAGGRAQEALRGWRDAQWQLERSENAATDAERAHAALERRIAAARETLREWRRA
jgi:hypothetical protein